MNVFPLICTINYLVQYIHSKFNHKLMIKNCKFSSFMFVQNFINVSFITATVVKNKDALKNNKLFIIHKLLLLC